LLFRTDIDGSSKFLKGLFRLDDGPGTGTCLDCGAGIGRISKRLLQRYFSKIDLVEQDPKFLEQAKAYFGEDETNKNAGDYICSGLQDFTPREAAYDVIWCQWVLGHLTDDDLVEFFKRAV
jgi:protein N-terminal methyltransferase